jgi:hypothetical protein
VTLDIDSSESPVHGAQEQSAYNHRSTVALEQGIRDYLTIHNKNPKAFAWTKNADDILASPSRFVASTGRA